MMDLESEMTNTAAHYAPTCPLCRRCRLPLTEARSLLLRKVAELNDAGLFPPKAALTRGEPNQTRAHHYEMLDELIHAGLLENLGGSGKYALRLTAEGVRAFAAC
jgi:hypothetical protein